MTPEELEKAAALQKEILEELRGDLEGEIGKKITFDIVGILKKDNPTKEDMKNIAYALIIIRDCLLAAMADERARKAENLLNRWDSLYIPETT